MLSQVTFLRNVKPLKSNPKPLWTSCLIISGAVYNIPICIWLMDTHPYNPPMVYVKPTSTMQIKSGRNVDMNGKIDLPYLREWKYVSNIFLHLYTCTRSRCLKNFLLHHLKVVWENIRVLFSLVVFGILYWTTFFKWRCGQIVNAMDYSVII